MVQMDFHLDDGSTGLSRWKSVEQVKLICHLPSAVLLRHGSDGIAAYGGMGCNLLYGLGLGADDGTILSLVSTAATGSRCFGDITRDPVIPYSPW